MLALDRAGWDGVERDIRTHFDKVLMAFQYFPYFCQNIEIYARQDCINVAQIFYGRGFTSS
jgi:hypothetical protein